MGYVGRKLIARSSTPLSELLGIEPGQVLGELANADGWGSTQLDNDLRDAVQRLVAETGAPALSAYILDSDTADVEALTPAGVSWHVYLHAATAREYGAPDLEQTLDEVVEQALAWSAEAGLT